MFIPTGGRMRSRRFRSVYFLVALLTISLAAAAQISDQDIERRVDSLLQKMTLEEKAGQVTQMPGNNPETLEMVKQGKVGSLLGVIGAKNNNDAQRVAVEQSRLKIPLILGYDVIHGFRRIFPVPLGSAASFAPPFLEQAERVSANESTAAGLKWTFEPMVDIARDPRWGRIVEGAGEDPYLGSVIAAAKVPGLQGKDMADPQSLVACAKHYVAYGATEGGRDYNTEDISQQ